ncbi:hypothetical protein LWI28_017555 [Acer negundo]|uniref:Reverse transcriptase Ty1/copia-type domain-containing protein n=1 Tax=Acer negundo TaxID=4023 RepID=A0AAD5NUY4_ACENE|nr:hypothetical protein LWI28_017555 [Acer negundo]
MKSLAEIYEQMERCQFTQVTEPNIFQDAVKYKERYDAMDEEIKALEKHKTWELVDLPDNKEVVGLKWVYKTKYRFDGSIKKYKVRLVAKGYMQREGIDFEETFAPAARFDTIRTVLALATHNKWCVYQFDVKSAFLNGVLDEEVYVWEMEAVETLIDGFSLRLEHTLPRMRRWTMHKRPRNFVKTISDLEANIRSGKAQVLEVSETTDDEAQTDYMVGVDFDMSVGPQFIPLMEMEMKEKNESLDDEDDGDDSDDGDDGGDGDDEAPTRKITVKRKALKKKKKVIGEEEAEEISLNH